MMFLMPRVRHGRVHPKCWKGGSGGGGGGGVVGGVRSS